MCVSVTLGIRHTMHMRRILICSLSGCTVFFHIFSYSDTLRAGQSGDRIPVGARFSPPVQTGPGANPASCTMGTGSFPEAKRPERGADHPPPSKCPGQERVGLYLYSPFGPSWPVIGAPLLYFILLGSLGGNNLYSWGHSLYPRQ